MRVSETPLFTGAEMPSTGWVLVTLPINATEFRVHRIARDLIGATGPQGPIGPAGLTGSTGPAGPAGTGGVFLDEAANLVFAGPAAGVAAQPTFRALVAADIPSLSATYLPLSGGTLTGSLVAVNFVSSKAESDLVTVGPHFQLGNPSGSLTQLLQLNTVGGLDFWSFDAALLGWTRSVSISKVGLLSGVDAIFSGNVQALALVADSGGVGPGFSGTLNIEEGGVLRYRIGTGLFGTSGNLVFERYDAAGVFVDGPLVFDNNGNATFIGAVTALRVVLGVSAVTYAATTNLDFNLAAYRTLALTGDVTFTTSNLAAGKTSTVKILCDATPRTFTFPAWKFMGTAPTGIAANKTGILSVTPFGAVDTDCVAAYAVEA